MNVTELSTPDFIDAKTIDIASDVIDLTFRITVVTPCRSDSDNEGPLSTS